MLPQQVHMDTEAVVVAGQQNQRHQEETRLELVLGKRD